MARGREFYWMDSLEEKDRNSTKKDLPKWVFALPCYGFYAFSLACLLSRSTFTHPMGTLLVL